MAARASAAAALILAAASLASPSTSAAASRYDPALRFRTLTTEHFVIYYHQGEDAIARRFGPIAEQVHAALARGLQRAPGGRTHVILVDQNDLANGWATPLPYDTIELTVSPPAPRESIGNVDDWLRLVFIHEYTHILHLDRSRGYASLFRHVFGRSPLAFPNLFLPPWQTEGIATYEESAMTGRGRMHAGDFRLLVTAAAREGQALALDRASSDVDDWPSGNTPYAYGGFFHQYLAERYGAEKLASLATRTAGRFYFLGTPAYKNVYGKSLGDLWKEFEQQASRASAGQGDRGRRLTWQGFVAAGPRFARDSRGRPVILFSSRTGHDFPALVSVDLDGRTSRLVSRYLGDETSVAAGAALYDEQDLSRSVAFRSDLHVVELASGRATRLTRNGRYLDPAIDAAGRAVAVVALREGQRTLQLFDLPAGAWPRDHAVLQAALRSTPRLDLREPGVDYSSPRWSPDGRWLAVSRHERSGRSEIVVFDPASGRMVPVASSTSARNVTPAWMPNGRTLLFASDRPANRTTSIRADPRVDPQPAPFNIFAVDVSEDANGSVVPGSLYQVTDFITGATYPDVSPDASLLAYVGYTAAGYDVFVLPIDRARWTPLSKPTNDRLFDQQPTTNDQQPGTTRPPDHPTNDHLYSPLPTILPRFWLPAAEYSDEQLRVGAQTAGSDVLGRHVYAATALVRVAGRAEAPGSRRYDWAASYVYDRWLPSFFVSASDRTHFLQVVTLESASVAVNADLREQNEQIGVLLPDVHPRHAQALSVSFLLQRQVINVGGLASRDSDRNGLRMAWTFSNAHTYALSISPEQGVTIGVTGEMVRQALGASASSDAATGDVRAYLRLGSRHSVLAARAAVGAAWGDPRTARRFYLGGNGGNEDPASFDSDAFNLLRGFDLNSAVGDRLAVFHAEYRVPLVRPNRGHGTFPVFLRTVHATAFVDAGTVWRGGQVVPPLAASVGAELAAAWRLGYQLPLMIAGGVAWPRAPAGTFASPTGYVRLGYAF